MECMIYYKQRSESVRRVDPFELASYIKKAPKVTPVKAYFQGNMEKIDFKDFKVFGEGPFRIIFGEYKEVKEIIDNYHEDIYYYEIESDRRNSAIPLLKIKELDARIEPGAIIRDQVIIENKVIVMMGAVINIGAHIKEKTMIDMNAVVGARAQIGANCHIGAGAVIAGVLEPPSKTPVIIEDNVMIGANAVVLEGVKVGKGAVVAAGAVVISDVEPNMVVAGQPAKPIKIKDQKTIDKTTLLNELR